LQLFSLKEASSYWNELVADLAAEREISDVEESKERMAFVLNCLGLSLSQLLGQNSPSPEADKMEEPGDLLGKLLGRTSIDRTTRRRLNRTFAEFLSYYGSIRHFGQNKGEQIYRKLEQLTMQELDRFRRMAIEIWDIVIAIPGNDVQLRSILDVVKFNELQQSDGP
jgi:hypothetical protein